MAAADAPEGSIRGGIQGWVLPLGAQLATFALLERALRAWARLPEEAYSRASFLSALPARGAALVGVAPLAAAAAALFVVALALLPSTRSGFRRIFEPWDSSGDGAALRMLIGFLTGIAAWTWSTYAYNAWLDRTHVLDRAVLVFLWAGVLWRPFVLPLFALALTSVIGQFDVPLPQFSWTEADLLVRIPMLAGSYWMVRAFSRQRSADSFLVLLVCLVAATYWWSGVGKLRIHWLSHPGISLLIFGAHANGWLAFLDSATIVRLSEAMRPFNRVLMAFTLFVECGALLILLNRATLRLFLALFIVFHTGVFLFSGIFFWKWMLVEAGLLVFFLHGGRIRRLPLFTPQSAVLSVMVIGLSPLWTSPGNLTWYDTPLTYSIRIEGEGESGAHYTLPASVFEPYAEMFVLGLFPYLSTDPQLTGTMGATTFPERADRLVGATDPEVVFALERQETWGRFDPDRSQRFAGLVASFADQAPNQRPLGLLGWVQAPRHLWSAPWPDAWDGQERLTRLQVVEATLFFDGVEHREIRRRQLRSIDLPQR